MVEIKISKKNDSIVLIECDGHTGYGVEGEDIVCAAVSSIVQTALLGLLQVAGVDVKYEIVDVGAYLKIEIPDGIDEGQRHDADVILNTMLLGLADLYQGYSDFVNLEVN